MNDPQPFRIRCRTVRVKRAVPLTRIVENKIGQVADFHFGIAHWVTHVAGVRIHSRGRADA